MKTLTYEIKIEDIEKTIIFNEFGELDAVRSNRATVETSDFLVTNYRYRKPRKAFMGPVQPRDVGKRIYNVDGVYQVESDEQVQERLNKKKKDKVEIVTTIRCAKCLAYEFLNDVSLIDIKTLDELDDLYDRPNAGYLCRDCYDKRFSELQKYQTLADAKTAIDAIRTQANNLLKIFNDDEDTMQNFDFGNCFPMSIDDWEYELVDASNRLEERADSYFNSKK